MTPGADGAPPQAQIDEQLARSRTAVFVVFIGSGFAFAGWAAQIPQVRDRLDVNPAELGIILLALAVGSVTALPLAGLVIARFGERRTVAVMALLLSLGLLIAALGYQLASIPWIVAGLVCIGFGNGTWDVAMNVHGAVVERRLRRVLMPRFHAGFSVGTVFGALIGAAATALRIPPALTLAVIGVVVAATVPVATTGFLPREPSLDASPQSSHRNALRAWAEPRTLLIGVFVLCTAFTEGTGNDWLGVAVIDGYGAPDALGTVTFAVFLAAMTTGRWFGTGLIDRHGRLPVVRAAAALATLGLAVVILGTWLPVAMLGAALWGLGASLGFPVGMSAAADDPVRAAARVSVVASIGYVAFLAGPPLIGFLGDRVGVLHALSATAALIVVALLVSGAVRPLPDEGDVQFR